jgi:hypothetical protein
MPLNESTSKPRRERWPLEFDLTGVPRDTATRKNLLEQKRSLESVNNEETMSPAAQSVRTITENRFTVDQPSTDVFITDINNPPRKNFNPYDAKNQYPKMLYHHKTGRVLQVANEKEEKASLKRGFELKPSPDFDYSKVSRAGIAAKATVQEKREEEMSAEELAALDEQDQAG